uniref:ZP domain-containing protein n=1 Tax=Anopheles atroparvus TaxID=41427 RepID=A0A182ISJ3_ANOAO
MLSTDEQRRGKAVPSTVRSRGVSVVERGKWLGGKCWPPLEMCSVTVFPARRPREVTGQDSEFAPHVTATCKSGTMNIRIQFAGPYNGVVHARDFRTPACMANGNGSASMALSLNLLAKSGNSEYCGILISNVSGGDRTVLSVYWERGHRFRLGSVRVVHVQCVVQCAGATENVQSAADNRHFSVRVD